MPLITARECRKLLKEAEGVEKMVADELVCRFDAAIRKCAQRGQTRTHVTVPTFIYGTPGFDRQDVEDKVKSILQNNGFAVKDAESEAFTLEISWEDVGDAATDGGEDADRDAAMTPYGTRKVSLA